MSKRILYAAAAQMGPIARDEPRATVVARLIALLNEAAERRVELVVFPELTLTSFFPRWFFEDESELLPFYETEMPNAVVQPLFDAAKAAGIGFYLGYAELTPEGRRFNTSILVDKQGNLVGKYRKVHLPGHSEHEPWRPFQHLEKRYFEPGDYGFPVFETMGGTMGMAICNDRRWPETYRVMGLQGAEVIMLGYNTPTTYAPVPQHDHLQGFHNHLSMQAGAYQNGSYVIGTAKAGIEEGCMLLGQSCIIAPTGEIIVQASTIDDELIVAKLDLDLCAEIKKNVFDFDLHRQPQHYGIIAAPKKSGVPPV
jgi:N-carbamoyl-D-amino-acid hydrolase